MRRLRVLFEESAFVDVVVFIFWILSTIALALVISWKFDLQRWSAEMFIAELVAFIISAVLAAILLCILASITHWLNR